MSSSSDSILKLPRHGMNLVESVRNREHCEIVTCNKLQFFILPKIKQLIPYLF